ncbi:MAG: EF-hand domain-containing protein, partial [Pseudomonadota bacterium]
MINVNASVFDPTAIATRANERFDAADTDGNGTISKGEFSEVLTARGVDGGHADEFFARLDANGDGTLSRD